MGWGYNPFTGTLQRLGGPAGPAGPAGPTDIALTIPVTAEGLSVATGNPGVSVRLPLAITLAELRLESTDAPVGAAAQVDVLLNGTTILGANKLSIDAGEDTSVTAATSADIVTTALPDNGRITFYVIQTGVFPDTGTGYKVTLIGTITP